MIRRTKAATGLAAAFVFASGCDRVGELTTPSIRVTPNSRAALIDGTPGFSFQPPIAPRSHAGGEFDASLSPVVEICEWSANACALPLVSRFTDVKLLGEHYGVDWQTNGLGLDAAKTYRIRVLVAGTELGAADVDVVKNGEAAKNVDASRHVALVAGRTLPIKFRISKGAVWVVGAAGGSISAAGGQVQIEIPPGAVEHEVGITVQPTSVAAPEGGFLVAGATYEFGPHGLTFGAPVQLAIAYDDANLPADRDEHELRLLHFTDGAWEGVPGSIVNVEAHTVTGAVTSFSPFAPGSGALIELSGSGTATLDGAMKSFEWPAAGCVSFPANLPGGSTTPAKVCIMNDGSKLYAGLTISVPAGITNAWLVIDLDNTDNGYNVGDDVLQASCPPPMQSCLEPGTFVDAFLTPDPNGILRELPDVMDAGSPDVGGKGKFDQATGSITFEMSHPLNTTDNAHDFSVGAGDVVGFSFSVVIQDASGVVSATFFPSSANHGHIVIAAAVDQEQPVIDASVGGLVIGGQSDQKLAQVVTAGLSGKLVEVRFPAACENGALVVEIQDVTSGQPNGTVLASETIAAASLPHFPPNPPSFRGIAFTTPATVTASKPFAIVLKNPTGSCGVFQGPVGDPYAGGDAFYDAGPNAPGVWLLLGTRQDLPFQTVVK